MKKWIRFIFILITLLSSWLYSTDAFERNCVECHKRLPATLQRMFFNYLLVYSGEKNTKAGLFYYMRYPYKDISVMSELFIQTIGIKKPLDISNRELREAIDIYWEKYRVIGRVK
jgi:hypothetical protein